MFIDKYFNSVLNNTIFDNYYIVTLLSVFLLAAAIIDIRTQKIPNELVVLLLIIRILLIPFIGISVYDFIGAILCFISLLIPGMIIMNKMGGDIKLMTVVGLYIGLTSLLFLLIISIYGILLISILLLLKFNRKVRFPFAPMFLLSHLSTFCLIQLIK